VQVQEYKYEMRLPKQKCNLFASSVEKKNNKNIFYHVPEVQKGRESDTRGRQVALVSERQNGTGNAAADSKACLKTKERHSCHRVICILLTLHPLCCSALCMNYSLCFGVFAAPELIGQGEITRD